MSPLALSSVLRVGAVLLPLWIIACLGPLVRDPGPARYRLAGSGTHWDVVGRDHVLDDLQPRYPEFFEAVLDPAYTEDPNVLPLREDLEAQPADRRNYDALNALAIAYFEFNYRGETTRTGMGFLGQGFRAAKILAVPWRAYGEIEEAALRDAILDFFADVASGEKLGSARTRGRITRIVASLEKKEQDPARLARIRALVRQLEDLVGEGSAGASGFRDPAHVLGQGLADPGSSGATKPVLRLAVGWLG